MVFVISDFPSISTDFLSNFVVYATAVYECTENENIHNTAKMLLSHSVWFSSKMITWTGIVTKANNILRQPCICIHRWQGVNEINAYDRKRFESEKFVAWDGLTQIAVMKIWFSNDYLSCQSLRRLLFRKVFHVCLWMCACALEEELKRHVRCRFLRLRRQWIFSVCRD